MKRVFKNRIMNLVIFCLLFQNFFLSPANSFTLTPARQTIVIDPGSNAKVQLNILNDQKEIKKFKAEIQSFEVDEKTGNIKYTNKDAAINWVQVNSNDINLNPGQNGKVIFTINVPENILPGSHYLALTVNELPLEGEQISVSTRIVSLLFLYVGGQIKEDLSRLSFGTEKKYFFSQPTNIILGLKNFGSIHAVPQGEIVLKNMNGKEFSKININPGDQKILPNGVFEKEFSFDKFSFGQYGKITAELNIKYGMSGKQIHDSTTLWYLPWPLLIVLIILILVFIIFIVFIKSKKDSQKNKKPNFLN